MARNGHAEVSWRCPLLGEQRKTFASIWSFSGGPNSDTSGCFPQIDQYCLLVRLRLEKVTRQYYAGIECEGAAISDC